MEGLGLTFSARRAAGKGARHSRATSLSRDAFPSTAGGKLSRYAKVALPSPVAPGWAQRLGNFGRPLRHHSWKRRLWEVRRTSTHKPALVRESACQRTCQTGARSGDLRITVLRVRIRRTTDERESFTASIVVMMASVHHFANAVTYSSTGCATWKGQFALLPWIAPLL